MGKDIIQGREEAGDDVLLEHLMLRFAVTAERYAGDKEMQGALAEFCNRILSLQDKAGSLDDAASPKGAGAGRLLSDIFRLEAFARRIDDGTLVRAIGEARPAIEAVQARLPSPPGA